MTRNRIVLVIVWALSLIIVGVFAHAQTPAQRGATPAIISGRRPWLSCSTAGGKSCNWHVGREDQRRLGCG